MRLIVMLLSAAARTQRSIESLLSLNAQPDVGVPISFSAQSGGVLDSAKQAVGLGGDAAATQEQQTTATPGTTAGTQVTLTPATLLRLPSLHCRTRCVVTPCAQAARCDRMLSM